MQNHQICSIYEGHPRELWRLEIGIVELLPNSDGELHGEETPNFLFFLNPPITCKQSMGNFFPDAHPFLNKHGAIIQSTHSSAPWTGGHKCGLTLTSQCGGSYELTLTGGDGRGAGIIEEMNLTNLNSLGQIRISKTK